MTFLVLFPMVMMLGMLAVLGPIYMAEENIDSVDNLQKYNAHVR